VKNVESDQFSGNFYDFLADFDDFHTFWGKNDILPFSTFPIQI